MKQHITINQLNELSEKGKERLHIWLWNKGYIYRYRRIEVFKVLHLKSYPRNLTTLDIGQMIEFLDEHRKEHYGIINECGDLLTNNLGDTSKNFVIWWKGELCNTLWEAVKEVLDNKENK